MIKQKLQYLGKIFKSIFQDIKSWEQIKLNNWHWHGPGGIVVGILTYLVLTLTFKGVHVVGQFVITTFLSGLGIWAFELSQRTGRIIEDDELFESNKDLFVTWVPAIITIATILIFFKTR